MRERFHVPDHYFLSHSVGCLPRTTQDEVGSDFFGPWQDGSNWANWMPLLDHFRSGIAGLLSVDTETICPQINVSSALTKVLHSRPVRPDRPVILLTRQDFPTIGFVIRQAECAGYQMRFMDGYPTDPKAWDAAIDEQVAFVHVTHALSDTSHMLPVAKICQLARRAGALSIVDVAQSAIVVPTPIDDWRADYVTGTSVKFLCGGPGACFLYVSPEQLPLSEPLDVGWFSHENPFEMDIERFRWAKDAMRFFGGTPSPLPLVTANAALDVWQSLDLTAVRQRVQSHLDHLTEAVPEACRVSPDKANQRGGTLAVKPSSASTIREALAEHSIRHDERESGLRFSVHGYTSDAEIDRLASILRTHL